MESTNLLLSYLAEQPQLRLRLIAVIRWKGFTAQQAAHEITIAPETIRRFLRHKNINIASFGKIEKYVILAEKEIKR